MKIELINTQEIKKEFELELIIVNKMKQLNGKDKNELEILGFSSKENQSIFLNNRLFIGCNKLKDEDLKIAISNAIRIIKKTKYKTIFFSLICNAKELDISKIVEGLVLGGYSFNKYKKSTKNEQTNFFIDIKGTIQTKAFLEKELKNSLTISKSVNLVRDIINTTPEDYYPKTMAKTAKKIAKNNGLECRVYGENYLKKSKMNAMLAVGRASPHKSQLIHLIYKPSNAKGKIVLVGKGLTYDSGGLSLKSGAGMVSMKCDKSGGSAVLGVMNSLKDLACEYEVHGIVGAVENMIGADAFKPDDVLVARNGVSIEVRNTDAEGRLVLADCLCYAQDKIKKIDYIFDLATLTGACIVGLGEYTTGVMGHSEKLKKKLNKASQKSGELVGFLPYNRYLTQMINSQIADISNSASSRMGGAITASLFLDHFIKKENKNKWLHLDIAGAAYREKSWGYNTYGATGAGVRLMLEFIKLESLKK